MNVQQGLAVIYHFAYCNTVKCSDYATRRGLNLKSVFKKSKQT